MESTFRVVFEPYVDHCLSISGVHISFIIFNESMRQNIKGVKNVLIQMKIYLLRNDDRVDVDEFTANIIIKELVGHVTIESVESTIFKCTEQSPSSLRGIAVYVSE